MDSPARSGNRDRVVKDGSKVGSKNAAVEENMSEDWDESPAPNMGGVRGTVEEEADNELLRQVGVWRVCTCACVHVCGRAYACVLHYTHTPHSHTDMHAHTHTHM